MTGHRTAKWLFHETQKRDTRAAWHILICYGKCANALLLFIAEIHVKDACLPIKAGTRIAIGMSAWDCINIHWKIEITHWPHSGKIMRGVEMIFLERVKCSSTSSSWLAQLSFITCHITLVTVLAAPWDMPQPRHIDWNHFSSQLGTGHVIKELRCCCANIGWLT